MRIKTLIFLIAGGAIFGACSMDFDPYNKVTDFRVLSLRSSPSTLLPAQSTTLDANIVNANGPLSYRWSWCPVTSGGTTGYECSVTREAFENQVNDLIPTSAGFSLSLPDYDLGINPQASFTHSFPSQVIEFYCDTLSTQIPELESQAAVPLPSCEDGLPITIRLEADDGQQTITSIHEIKLLTDEDTPNTNPSLDSLFFAPGDEAQFTNAEEMALNGSSVVATGQEYTLFTPINPNSSESYVDASGETIDENLFVTWFFTDGESQFERTSFLPNGERVIPLENAEQNVWTAPDTPGSVTFFIVLRDDRGGIDWLQRSIQVQ